MSGDGGHPASTLSEWITTSEPGRIIAVRILSLVQYLRISLYQPLYVMPFSLHVQLGSR